MNVFNAIDPLAPVDTKALVRQVDSVSLDDDDNDEVIGDAGVEGFGRYTGALPIETYKKSDRTL